MENLTREELIEDLRYCPVTGAFFWKKSGRGRNLNKPAGNATSNGYVRISVLDKVYQAHRLVWLYMTGEFPCGFIDHINGNKTDNRYSNLRLVNKTTNGQNRRRGNKNSRTGLLGAYATKNPNKWSSSIQVNGKPKYLGVFPSAIDAHKAYLKTKRQLHAGCTI